MSYLYNMYAGSFANLRKRLDAVDLTDPAAVKKAVKDHDPETYENLDLDEDEVESGTEEAAVMSALISGTWIPSPGECINWIDWHDEPDFLEHAKHRLSRDGAAKVGALLADPPLYVSPPDWGFCGSLEHADVVALRDELASVLPASLVVSAASSSSTAGAELVGGLPVDLMLAWVLVSLRAVPDGLDVAVHLG